MSMSNRYKPCVYMVFITLSLLYSLVPMFQESRLKEPNYYLRKQNRKPPEQELVMTNSNAPRVDIDKEIKELQFHRKQKLPVKSNSRPPVILDTVRPVVGNQTAKAPKRYVPHDNYSAAYMKDRQSLEKLYYGLWRTAFSNAIEKLRETKVNNNDIVPTKLE